MIEATVGYIVSGGKVSLPDDPHYGDEWTLLISKVDFKWYKVALDLKERRELEHNGEPDTYPCFVQSEYHSELDAADWWSHTFIYREAHRCEACGHTAWVWPVAR